MKGPLLPLRQRSNASCKEELDKNNGCRLLFISEGQKCKNVKVKAY